MVVFWKVHARQLAVQVVFMCSLPGMARGDPYSFIVERERQY